MRRAVASNGSNWTSNRCAGPCVLDLKFKAAKALAKLFLRWSEYWADVAESVHTGESIAAIRERRSAAARF